MARSSGPSKGKSPYSVHPGVAMIQKWLAELPQKTGKSLEEWIRVVQESGQITEKARAAWLKRQHGFGTNSANWLAARADGKGKEDEDPETYLKQAAAWVEEMFGGPKAGLRPIFEQLVKLGKKLGPDVKVCPCKTIVPLYRRYVFAQIKPTTRTRIDLGLALRETRPTGPLIDTGGLAKGDRITHRIPITSLADIDDEVKHWLKAAYDFDA